MRSVKRKMCYMTNDGKIWKTPDDAQGHIAHLVTRLDTSKTCLKNMIISQKLAKKVLHNLFQNGTFTLPHGGVVDKHDIPYYQRYVIMRRDDIRRQEKAVKEVRDLLAGRLVVE